MTSRLKKLYDEQIAQQVKKDLSITNDLAIPKLDKVVLSMGLGRHTRDSKLFEDALDNLTLIAGQKAVVVNAKKSIAEFSIRAGMPAGVLVTLRKKNMYNFIDRFIHIALPRARDFRGFKASSFDGRGNMNIGIKEQNIFLEVDYLKSITSHGLNIAIKTTADNDAHALALLKRLHFPFV